MPFADTWNAIQRQLVLGSVIPNWTAHKGSIGEPFKIVAITSTHIDVDAPGARSVQKVPIADFEEVYQLWEEYRHAGLSRSALTPLTRYSKYIISILHWLETQSNGRLP
jgi:hypothetical protein